MEPALEATEYTVRAMESESRQVSLKRNKSNLEGSVAIEMSAQPLLELTPMAGSGAFKTSTVVWDTAPGSACVGSNNTSTPTVFSTEFTLFLQLKMFSPLLSHVFFSKQQRVGGKPPGRGRG